MNTKYMQMWIHQSLRILQFMLSGRPTPDKYREWKKIDYTFKYTYVCLLQDLNYLEKNCRLNTREQLIYENFIEFIRESVEAEKTM